MEFMVTRTSDWSYSKPCDEAYQKDYMRKDIRTLKSFEEYDYQRLQAQTFADYLVALQIAYEQERSRINGEVE